MEERVMNEQIFKVALLQMVSCGSDIQANLAKGEAFCRQARDMGADIALFPEMWSNGYSFFTSQAEYDEWVSDAVSQSDPFFRHFQALAQKLDMAIALTYLEKWQDAPRNSVSIINRHGDGCLTYAKVHTCEFDIEAACTPGDDFPVCSLDTAAGNVQVGAMICYDREFPESARLLMLNGAEIILTPNACDLEINRLAQFRTRAFENMTGVAMANYAAPQQNGQSVAYDGMAFDDNGQARDMTLVHADDSEGVFLAVFDIAKLRTYREFETMGNAFRKPRLYGALASLDVQPPFIRSSARR
jgi:N-carbamoylputrescine amidase